MSVDTSNMTTDELIRREADAVLNGTGGTASFSSTQLPASLGVKTAAASLSIAPASDATFTATVSSAQLPATLGTKTAAASLAIAPASDATFAAPSVGFDVQTTITRPANQTPYTAGDVVGGALDLGVLGPSGKSILITSVQLELDIAAIPTGMTSFTLQLYSVTPPSALADNAAWDLPSGDRPSFLGSVALGSPVDLGSTLYVEQNGVNKQVKLAGTHLFAYLVTTGGFTPAANSEVYAITPHTLAV